jgi:hypothetical protein
MLYLHVFDWPTNSSLVIGGLKSEIKSAHLLASSRALPLAIRHVNPLDVYIQGLPSTAPDTVDSVIVVESDGEPVGDKSRLLSSSARNTLRVFDGELRGKTVRFGAGKTRDADVENWSKESDSIAWPIRLSEPASLEVQADYDAPSGSAGGSFTISIGTNTVSAPVQSGEQRGLKLGRVKLSSGAFEIQVLPKEIRGSELMRLRSVTLTPAEPLIKKSAAGASL